jgi:serine/threonine protein kinase
MSDESEQGGLILEGIESAQCHHCGVQMDVLGVEPFQTFRCPECGTPFTVPARLGAFLLLSQIGRGGMGGVVFLAHDESLDRNVAIKVMPASLGLDEAAVATFRREAQAAARLNHPNIAQVYSFGQDHGQPYLVMELLSGVSLDKLIEQKGPLDQDFAIRTALQIAQGLRAADEAGLTHGDIKPENILFDEKMNAKLVDFGIASFVHQQSDGVWGTPYYIAPERLMRQKADARTDMYCLGGTLYHALTGRPPFEGSTPMEVVRARLDTDPVPPREIRPEIRAEIQDILLRMLKRDPAARHPTYASLIGDLGRAVKQTTESARPPDAPATKGGKKISVRLSQKNGRVSAPMRPSKVTSDASASEPAPAAPAGPPRRSGARVFKVLAILLVLAGLIGGGVWLALRYQKREQQEQSVRRGALDLAQARRSADESWAAVVLAASNVHRSATSASNFVGSIVKTVETAHHLRLEVPPPPLPPESSPPTGTNAPPAGTNAPPAAATNAPAAAAGAGTGQVASVAATNVPPPAAAEPPPEVPVKVEEPEMVAIGRRALAAVRDTLNAADTAEQAVEEARRLHQDTLNAKSVVLANSNVTALATLANQCRALEPEAKRKAEEVKKLAQSLDEMRGRREKEDAARQKREAAEAEQRRIEQEKRDAEAREKEASEGELAAARLLRTKVSAHLRAYAFKKAIAELSEEKPRYATAIGKAEWQRIADRYAFMAALHAKLIGLINAKPFPWGWIQGTAQDITGADEEAVRTKTRTYPWAEVSIRQYLHIINHYLGSARFGGREQAELFLGVAVHCLESVEGSENAKAVESARTLADDFLRKAREAAPSIDEDIQRILPRE